jgi:hypothetical protein
MSNKNRIKDVESYWISKASNVLLNRTIVGVRYLLPEEAKSLGWYQRSVIFELDDGTLVFPSQDDEGNNGGSLFTTNKTAGILPVI